MATKVDLNEFNSSVRIRDAMRNIAAKVIDELRPAAKLATVQSVDRSAMKASVIMESDTEPTNVGFLPDDGPWGFGDLVIVQSTLGLMRISKVIYSPTNPGGTYMRPALGQPTYFGGANNDTISGVRYYSKGSDPGVGHAWYYGRWKSALSAPNGWAEVLLTQSGPSQQFTKHSIPIYSGATGGTWYKVTPQIRTASGSGFVIDLEINVTNSGGVNMVDFRARQTTAPSAGGPIIFDLEFHGAWTQDRTAVEAYSADSVPASTYALGY